MEPTIREQQFEHILAGARRGEREAVDEILGQVYPRVERLVHERLARDMRRHRPWLNVRFSTGDVVQEVFRDLVKDLGAFRGSTEDDFAGYLAMIVRNRLVDAIRFHEAAQRDGRTTDEITADYDPPSPKAGPASDAETEEEAAAFAAALRSFPEREQLLLRGRLESSLTFQELAKLLGYSSFWAARRAFFAAQGQLVVRLRQGIEG